MARVNIGEMPTGGGVNPNLLDNWYFVNPVNQRGLTVYDGANYGHGFIDRWDMRVDTTATLTDHGMLVDKQWFGQKLFWDNENNYVGYDLTFSFLTNYGFWAWTVKNYDGSWINNIGKDDSAPFYCELRTDVEPIKFNIIIRTQYTDVVFKAVKIETGQYSTLAKKGDDGEYHLIGGEPNYTEMFLNCAYYMQIFHGSKGGVFGNGMTVGSESNNSKEARIFVPTIVPLRIRPTFKKEGTVNLYYPIGGDKTQIVPINITTSNDEWKTESGIILRVTTNETMGSGVPVQLRVGGDSVASIIFDAGI